MQSCCEGLLKFGFVGLEDVFADWFYKFGPIHDFETFYMDRSYSILLYELELFCFIV